MENRFIALAIGLTVGTILLSGFLWPVVADATATEITYENEGYFNLEKATADDSVTITWDYTTPNKFIVNGEDVTYSNTTTMAQSIVLGEQFAVRFTPAQEISYYGAGNYMSGNATYPNITITYEGGTFTITNENTTRTISNVAEIWYISNTGEYVMKKSNSPAYLNSGSEIVADSEIYASGQTFSGSNYIFWHLEGTVDNIEYPDTFNSSLTVTDGTVNGEYSTICDDLFILNNITFTATTSSQVGVTYDITASYFVVPAEVTAEKSWHLDTTQIALVAAIGTLGAIVLIAAAAGSIRRLD